MGNTGSSLKKLRKSLRRLSLSRSREHLARGDGMRRSSSLMNLSALRRNVMQRKKSKSTTMISKFYQAQEIPKDELREYKLVITNVESPKSNTSPETGTNQLESSTNQDRPETRSIDSLSIKPEPSSDREIKLDTEKTDIKTIEEKTVQVNTQKIRQPDDEMISEQHSIDVSSNDSFLSQLEENSEENYKTNETKPATARLIYGTHDCSGVIALKKIDETLSNIEIQIEQMPREDLLVHLSTFKDEIHMLWKKSYYVESTSDEVQPKKDNTIDETKRVLHKLYNKAFKQHDYRISETNM